MYILPNKHFNSTSQCSVKSINVIKAHGRECVSQQILFRCTSPVSQHSSSPLHCSKFKSWIMYTSAAETLHLKEKVGQWRPVFPCDPNQTHKWTVNLQQLNNNLNSDEHKWQNNWLNTWTWTPAQQHMSRTSLPSPISNVTCFCNTWTFSRGSSHCILLRIMAQ